MKVNIKKIKHLSSKSHINPSKKRLWFKNVLFPLFFSPLIVSCQSTIFQQSSDLFLTSEPSTIAPSEKYENKSAFEHMKTPIVQKNLDVEERTQKINKEESKTAKSSKSINLKKSVVYTPTEKSKSEIDLELKINESAIMNDDLDSSNNENLVYTSSDNALIAESPDEIDSNTSSKMQSSADPNDSILLCEDTVYYNSWKSQFDQQWLALYGNDYKNQNAKNKALAQARTNEFIRIVYPSIEKTGFDFPVVINNQVLQWVNYFKNSGRKSFVLWLRRGSALMPEMEKILDEYGLPKDLKYLSMIESGYSPKALSYAGAVGLWQFMPPTARENGLIINDYLDERRDLKKSTKAAANYLSNLYGKFGSWHLAAASYNGGPGLVSRTLKNYGTDSSFFELTSMGVVNRQTADYVPKLIAAMIISKNPEKFGFDTTDAPIPTPSKTIQIRRSISLADLAKSLNMDKGILDSLNPELRLGITPPPHSTSEGYFELEVPASKYDHALLAVNTLPEASNKYIVAARINRRETLSAFATRYRINVSSILHANAKLKMNSRLHKGQVVYIPISLGTGQYDRFTSNKFLSKKFNKKMSAKNSHAVHNVSSKSSRLEVAHSSKSKSFAKAKKQSNSATLRKNSSTSKKVATSGVRKKQKNIVD